MTTAPYKTVSMSLGPLLPGDVGMAECRLAATARWAIGQVCRSRVAHITTTTMDEARRIGELAEAEGARTVLEGNAVRVFLEDQEET